MSEDKFTAEQEKVADQLLIEAVDALNYDRIKLCLKKGADINARNGSGFTPLMTAVWKENAYLVEFILARQPDLFARDGRGRSAFDLLSEVRDSGARSTITDTLLRALPDHARKQGATPVQAAAIAEAEASEKPDVTTSVDIKVHPLTVIPKNPPKGFKL
jgi:ankyrin repeat protein